MVGGVVRPRTSAALRLMTRSKCWGRSMGRSPGFAPCKILSTYDAERRYSAMLFRAYAIRPRYCEEPYTAAGPCLLRVGKQRCGEHAEGEGHDETNGAAAHGHLLGQSPARSTWPQHAVTGGDGVSLLRTCMPHTVVGSTATTPSGA